MIDSVTCQMYEAVGLSWYTVEQHWGGSGGGGSRGLACT